MKGFYRKDDEGNVQRVNELIGPGFVYNEENKGEYDGWKWFDSAEDAYKSFISENKITPRQIRLALLQVGITPTQITDMLRDNPAAFIEWEYASYVDENHPLVLSLGAALNKTEEDIRNILNLAKTL